MTIEALRAVERQIMRDPYPVILDGLEGRTVLTQAERLYAVRLAIQRLACDVYEAAA